MVSGLAAVFMQNRAALLRFLRARGAGEDAEDLLQELWLSASSAPAQPVAEPLAYLYRSANNLILDRLRAARRQSRREQDWSLGAVGASEAADHESGERAAFARDELRLVEATLASLGERTEAVFRRFRVDGVSQRDIAGEMGISLSAVEKHLQKAYRALIDLRRQIDAG